MQAFRATGFMGMGRPDYANQLLKNSTELYRALKTGTVLRGQFSVGQQIYGAAGQVLGHSQFQIGSNLAPIVAWTLKPQKESWGQILESASPKLFTDTALPPEPGK